ncbi:MAG: hypothetical protein IKR37_03870, partial [Paludibacteraceae bacterium]|nr:hypothetical protein [Paludibacteraceae bacterium]
EVLQHTDMTTDTAKRLVAHYQLIRTGIGAHKSPEQYGAFPFDPYSHTPSMAGVQQPGMTGQVKEDIISRWFELGIQVEDGQIVFAPRIINPADFDHDRLTFTYCGVRFNCELVNKGKNPLPDHIILQNSRSILPKEASAHIFARDGEITDLTVRICIDND